MELRQQRGNAAGMHPFFQMLQLEANLVAHQADFRHIPFKTRFAKILLHGAQQCFLVADHTGQQTFQRRFARKKAAGRTAVVKSAQVGKIHLPAPPFPFFFSHYNGFAWEIKSGSALASVEI